MLFSIIIINYKTKELTANCLNSLFALPNPETREIILIDNASNDGSIEKLAAEFKEKIKIIKNETNRGFAGANNQGAALAQGEFLIFLNSDTIIDADFITPCISVMQKNNNIGITSPRLTLPSGEYQKAAFGMFPTLFNLITQKTKKEILAPKEKEFFEVDWVSGCALIININLFTRLGGWDEKFFLYYEDIDICYRAKLLGFKSAIINNIKITHLGGKSLKISTEKKKIYYQSQDYYFKKHYKKITCLLIKIFRFIFILIKKYD